MRSGFMFGWNHVHLLREATDHVLRSVTVHLLPNRDDQAFNFPTEAWFSFDHPIQRTDSHGSLRSSEILTFVTVFFPRDLVDCPTLPRITAIVRVDAMSLRETNFRSLLSDVPKISEASSIESVMNSLDAESEVIIVYILDGLQDFPRRNRTVFGRHLLFSYFVLLSSCEMTSKLRSGFLSY
jgi:hypothetical protein